MKSFSAQDVPAEPGVYVFRNRSGEVIYVGKAKSLRKRLSSYFQPSRQSQADAKLRALINSIASYEVHVLRNETEALLLESRLIKQYHPRYNVLLRDDKRYPLIVVDPQEPFPRLQLTRIKRDDQRLYFGPFPQTRALRATVLYLAQVFALRTCKTRDPVANRHCFDNAMNRCCAPCTGKISAEAYAQRLEQALAVLQGDVTEVITAATAEMHAHAAHQRFEEAARFRDIIANLESIVRPQVRSFERTYLNDRRRDHSTSVAALQEALGMAQAPRLIEAFDISNIGGQMAVASMVCFCDGRPQRQSYRRYRIRSVEGSNDFAMMHEAVLRRYRRLQQEPEAPWPDLIVVDGGSGQLNSAIQALAQLQAKPVAILGLAKKNEELYLPGHREPLVLSHQHPGLQLLQTLRDEAHRFALAYHHQLRRQRIAASILRELEGIGPQRQHELLRCFGSVTRLRKATAAEIVAAVPGIGIELATRLCEFLTKRH